MKTKKLLAALLSSAMVLGTMAVPVFAADGDAVAEVNGTQYATLKDAVKAATTGQTVTLLDNVTYGTDHTIEVWETAFNLDLGGKTITSNSEQGITLSNKGYDGTAVCYSFKSGDTVSISNGTINTAYGAGVYVDDNMTATLSDLTINAATTNVQSTVEYSSAVRLSSGATAIINSGSYSAAHGGYAIAVSNSGGSVTINDGTFTGDLFFNANTNSGVTKSITINGGTFNGGFVNTDNGTLTITGGTFDHDPTAYVPTGYEAVKNGNTWTVRAKAAAVAQIGTTTYATLQEAMNAVQNGEEIVLLADVTQDDGCLFNREGVSAKLNLDGHTLTVNNGSNVNNRAIKINNGTLEVYNGKIVAAGSGKTSSDGKGCYGAFRVEANGKLNAHDLNLSNARPWGLNVKVCGGEATLTNVNITSSYGGGIEVTEADLGTGSKGGIATLTNCNFTQTGYFDHCSTPLSVSGGSKLTVNSGTYTGEDYVLYVFSSGGEIDVNGGTFTKTKDNEHAAIVAAIDLNTYPEYTGGLKISGGDFTGKYSITSPAYMEITGGKFSNDPTAYVPEQGYIVLDNNDSTYKFKVEAVKDATASNILSVLAKVADNETATVKSAANNGVYEQVTAAKVENESGVTKAFHVVTSDNGDYTINLNNIYGQTVVTGNTTLLCGLIIKNIPDTVTVTVTLY